MIPVVTPDEMRAIDGAAPEPVDVLIRRAGAAVAFSARHLLGGTYGRTVDVVAGKGNNGADGRVAAALLAEAGARVRCFDAADLPATLPPADLVIDAAYGTGFRGTWSPPPPGAPVLAVDIPSGVDGTTGEAGDAVWRAERTVTFAALKPGLLLGRGRELAGTVELADIGLDVSRATAHVVEGPDVARWWPPRPASAHKWRSAVRVVAGSPGMTGAPRLAARAAMRAGAGMVVLTVPGEAGGGAVGEVVGREAPPSGWADDVAGDLGRFGTLLVGPGLGRDEPTVADIRRLVATAAVPLVLDADGLHAVAGELDLVRQRSAPTILTPHDGEFAALAGSPPPADRLAAVRRLAAASGAVVLLKGPVTVIADPTGAVRIVADGDQRLATAGTGDVLAGIVAAALAQGLTPLDAAAAGAWIHAAAARTLPPFGMVAGDLPDALPTVFGTLRSSPSTSCTGCGTQMSQNQYKNAGGTGAGA